MCRNNNVLALLLLVAIFLLHTTNAIAAAWTQGQGKGQAIFTLNANQSLHSYHVNGDIATTDRISRQYEFSPFVEYGIDNDTTIGANPTLKYNQVISANSPKINTSVFESEIFIRRKLLEFGNAVFSVQPLIKTPAIISSDSGTVIDGNSYEAEIRALAGYGFKFDKKLFIDTSRSFSGQNHFVNIEVAYRKRNNGNTDVVKIDGTAGFRRNESVLFLGQFFSDIGVREHTPPESDPKAAAYIDRDINVKLQFSGVMQISQITSVQLGVYTGAYTEVTENRIRGYQGILISLWKGF